MYDDVTVEVLKMNIIFLKYYSVFSDIGNITGVARPSWAHGQGTVCGGGGWERGGGGVCVPKTMVVFWVYLGWGPLDIIYPVNLLATPLSKIFIKSYYWIIPSMVKFIELLSLSIKERDVASG